MMELKENIIFFLVGVKTFFKDIGIYLKSHSHGKSLTSIGDKGHKEKCSGSSH